jgi:aryl-alcohol dehydrogenase-like predicted oxidoreductase
MRPPLRRLGKSTLMVAPLALGGNVFGWTANEEESFRILDEFVGAGYNLIDTADTYSVWEAGHTGGESETIIGNWLRKSGRRDEVVLATKVGMDMGSQGKGLSAAHIADSAAASLRRLRTDCIDLYQAHIDDPTTRLDETLEAFSELVSEGSVRAIGASNYSEPRLREALRCSEERGFRRFESLQPRYNLIERAEYEGPLEELCAAERLGVLAYSSLAAGFLTGKYRSRADLGKSPRGVRAEPRLNDRGFRILAALDEVATRTESSAAAVALAWVMARPGVTAPIASARSVAQLEQLLQASALDLSSSSMSLLDEASRGGTT